MSSSATYRFSAPGWRLCVGLRPHAAERAPQPGREFLALLADRPGRHAVRQVEPGEPAGTVAHRRVDGHDGLARVLADRLVHLRYAERAERADDEFHRQLVHGHRHDGAGHDGLVVGTADPGQQRTATTASGIQQSGKYPRQRSRRRGPARAPRRAGPGRGRGGPRGRACAGDSHFCTSPAATDACRRYACSLTHHQPSCANTIRATPTAAHRAWTAGGRETGRRGRGRGALRGGNASWRPCVTPARVRRCSGMIGLPFARLAALRLRRDGRRAGERDDRALYGVIIVGRPVAVDGDGDL